MEVGSVREGEGFVGWGVDVDDAMLRIREEWPERPSGPGLGEICWLSLTEKGHVKAERVWERIRRQSD